VSGSHRRAVQVCLVGQTHSAAGRGVGLHSLPIVLSQGGHEQEQAFSLLPGAGSFGSARSTRAPLSGRLPRGIAGPQQTGGKRSWECRNSRRSSRPAAHALEANPPQVNVELVWRGSESAQGGPGQIRAGVPSNPGRRCGQHRPWAPGFSRKRNP